MKKAKRKNWTTKDDERLRELFPSYTVEEIAKKMKLTKCQVYNRSFFLGLKKSKEFLADIARKNTLRSDHGSRKFQFKKGHIPQNKGKKQAEYMSDEVIARTAKTRFKKGHLPKNTLYDGAIRQRKDKSGHTYLHLRIAKAKWVLYHRHIWEEAHGTIPKGYNIQFKDKNSLNCTLDNLYMVSRNKQMIENSGAVHLSDGMIALYLVGKRGKDKELRKSLMQNKPLLELKRKQLKLNRIIKKKCQS